MTNPTTQVTFICPPYAGGTGRFRNDAFRGYVIAPAGHPNEGKVLVDIEGSNVSYPIEEPETVILQAIMQAEEARRCSCKRDGC